MRIRCGIIIIIAMVVWGGSLKAEEANPVKLLDEYILLQKQGKNEEAIPVGKRVLTILEAKLGPNHPYIASIVNSLATIYKLQARYSEA